jgi:hypothetical protein
VLSWMTAHNYIAVTVTTAKGRGCRWAARQPGRYNPGTVGAR